MESVKFCLFQGFFVSMFMHGESSCHLDVLKYMLKCLFCRDILLKTLKRCADLSPHGNPSAIPCGKWSN